MIKQLILLFHLVGAFFFQLIFSGDVQVTQKMDSNVKSGDEFVVEIKINKDNVSGFAKVQQELPEGFYAEMIDGKGATFSFDERKVKFIWMTLPEEDEFTISYKVKVDESIIGDYEIGGVFSYIADNERFNIDIPIANISVSNEDYVEGDDSSKKDVDVDFTNVGQVIKLDRTIEKVDETTYKVMLYIDKKGIEGFVKITEIIPVEFVATAGEVAEGIFSFKKNKLKVVWIEIPSDDFIISYTLNASEPLNPGDYDVTGTFSYIENDETKIYNIKSSTILIEGEEDPVVVDDPVVDDPIVVVDPVVVDDPVVDDPIIVDDPIVDDPVVDDPVNDIVSIPSPEADVRYKVQIAAGHRKVSERYFENMYKLKDKYSIEMHEGWRKYVLGSYKVYKGARDRRNIIRRNYIEKAFVTAYNQGDRITVQEALMISNQKWYQ